MTPPPPPPPAPLDELLRRAVECQQGGRTEEAEILYREVLAREPGNVAALHLLGLMLLATRREGALELLRKAAAAQPDAANVWNNLAFALLAHNEPAEAEVCARRAVGIRPDYAIACHNLGTALLRQSRRGEAIAAFRKAVELQPRFAAAWSDLGAALLDEEQHEEAIAALQRALEIDPRLARAHNNWGSMLRWAGKQDEAAAAYARAIELDRNLTTAHQNLGGHFDALCQFEEALQCYDRALATDPQSAALGSDRIFLLHHHPGYDAPAILAEQRPWNRRHAAPLAARIRTHDNDPAPERPLRIGYLSPDFSGHPLGRNLLPLVREHDRSQFRISCYSTGTRIDDTQRAFQQHADHWLEAHDLDDDRLAERIRQDRIDILVDLALHSANNRLLVMARKPAPVQVTFGGYPAGTGLDAIDYRLTDAYLDPPGETDANYAERSIRLRDSFWCYDPEAMGVARLEEAGAPPAIAAGHITFGNLGNPNRMNDEVLRLWARALNDVPDSRLLLLAPPGSRRERVLATFERENVVSSRIAFTDRLKRAEYFAAYRTIDIVLDTFPYNGHTTSLDALWMGVPVVTLRGRTAVGRAGLSFLSNLGLTELVAGNAADYVRIATGLAGDPRQRAELRSSLRSRMLRSPLTNAAEFARQIENAYRAMWREWCTGRA